MTGMDTGQRARELAGLGHSEILMALEQARAEGYSTGLTHASRDQFNGGFLAGVILTVAIGVIAVVLWAIVGVLV